MDKQKPILTLLEQYLRYSIIIIIKKKKTIGFPVLHI